MERIRRTLAILALLALAAGSFQPYYLRVWRQDWRAMGAYLTELPYRKIPGLRRLLVEADRRTLPGRRILFAMPAQSSAEAYDYAFGRAQYFLGAKVLVPRFAKRTDDVDYVLCWSRCTPPRGFKVLWSSEVGVLARRP